MGNGMRGETKEEIVEGDKNHTHLQSLQPVTLYRLTLSAQNEIGSSEDSESISVTTLEEGKKHLSSDQLLHECLSEFAYVYIYSVWRLFLH